MDKLKVLIAHNYYQVPGGEDTVVENERYLLEDNGHQVILYTRHNNEIENKGIVSKLLLPLETIFSFKTYYEIKKIIKTEKIDIVHVHNTLPLISPSVYYAAKHSKVKVVQTIHNFRLVCPGATLTRNQSICEDCINKSLGNAIKNKCYRNSTVQSTISSFNLWFHRKIGTYKKVDGYIALTEFNLHKVSSVIQEEKIFIKPNTIKNLNRINEKRKQDYFLFLGRLDELKGIELLVETWKSIDNATLMIVGTGPLESKIKESIKRYNISNIKLLGFKSKEEVMNIICHAKALIVPSQWYEGFPMTIVESFSLGVPVIAGNIGNLATIVEHNKNGLLFEYNNSKDLHKKIKKLIDSESLLNEVSEGAQETFNQKYHYELNYRQLVDIYENV